MNPSKKQRLRGRFLEGLLAIDPGFEEQKLRSPYIHPGEIIYIKKSCDMLWLVIVLIIDRHGRDRFSIEIGWSKLGRFPHLSMRPTPDQPEGGIEFSLDEYICRLGHLIDGKDKWWNVPFIGNGPEEQDPVAPVVQDAIEQLRNKGLPYLERFKNAVGNQFD